jgi:hypothetical protein
VLIVGCFIYDLSMWLVSSPEGLPFGYLLMHVEFADLSTLFKRSLWGSAMENRRPAASGSERPRDKRIVLFIAVVVVSCILVNLMCPATAVLLLPTLGWQILPSGSKFFDQTAAAYPPNNTKILVSCTAQLLAAGNYSCTFGWSGQPLDIEILPLEVIPYGRVWRNRYNGNTNFDTYFHPNISMDRSSWVASRQAINALTSDYADDVRTQEPPTFQSFEKEDFSSGQSQVDHARQHRLYKDSLRVYLIRQRTSFAQDVYCSKTVAKVRISEGREAHCYTVLSEGNKDGKRANSARRGVYLSTPNIPDYRGMVANKLSDADGNFITKCIRTGSGWQDSNTLHAQSSFDDAEYGTYTADVYAADRAIYLASDTYHCIKNNSILSGRQCGWDAMFQVAPPPDI